MSPSFELVQRGVVLGLAIYLGASIAASLAVGSVWRRLLRRPMSAAGKAQLLFLLRLLPTAAALFAAIVLFVPGYLQLEPLDSNEPIKPLLLAIACGPLWLMAQGLLRGARAWHQTRSLERAWSKGASPLALGDMQAHKIEHAFPLVTVAGLMQPRLYVAEQVLRGLDADEWTAVMAHERAHVSRYDNLRRLLLDSCPDVLSLLPTSQRLLDAWTEATEEAADDVAAGGDAMQSLCLAQALVKVARMVPAAHEGPLPALALHNGEALARRIERLLHGPVGVSGSESATLRLLGISTLVATFVLYAPMIRMMHEVAEELLAVLS